jgi:hypothetical protein
VLHAIGLHADKDGRAFPSMARIAEIAGINRGNVPRAVGRLEQRGLMLRQRAPKPNGGWQANHYQLLYEPIEDVINGGDRAVMSSAHMTADVISIDDARPRPGVINQYDGVSSARRTGCHMC